MHPSPAHRRDAVELLLDLLSVGSIDETQGLADEERLVRLAAGPKCDVLTVLAVSRLVAFGFRQMDSAPLEPSTSREPHTFADARSGIHRDSDAEHHAARGSSQLVSARLVVLVMPAQGLGGSRGKMLPSSGSSSRIGSMASRDRC